MPPKFKSSGNFGSVVPFSRLVGASRELVVYNCERREVPCFERGCDLVTALFTCY
jgi:hypothetical protein